MTAYRGAGSSVSHAAMGLGFVPIPFLAMYAVLFISRGFIVPASPPDVTGSATGEGLAGLAAIVLIVVLSSAIAWMSSGRRRWPFVVLQLSVACGAGYCVYDRDTGPIWIPLLVLACSLGAIGTCLAGTRIGRSGHLAESPVEPGPVS